MKKLFCMLTAFLSCLCLLSSCAATSDSGLYKEIIFDGKNTHIDQIEAGMSIEDVLSALNLTQEDFTVTTYETDKIPGVKVRTEMTSKITYQYDGLDERLAFEKIFIFDDGKLKRAGYNCHMDVEDTASAYDLAKNFVDEFVKASGAKSMKSGKGFEYNVYGTTEKDIFIESGGQYVCQFINGGALSEIALAGFSTAMYEGTGLYENDMVIALSITFAYE